MYALWSVWNHFRETRQEEKEDLTSCPARRKINMFPKRGKTRFKDAERSGHTHKLFVTQRCLAARFVLCGIQKATEQIIAFFYFIRIPASFHHFQHVLLLEA
jgi:hypothetical protein